VVSRSSLALQIAPLEAQHQRAFTSSTYSARFSKFCSFSFWSPRQVAKWPSIFLYSLWNLTVHPFNPFFHRDFTCPTLSKCPEVSIRRLLLIPNLEFAADSWFYCLKSKKCITRITLFYWHLINEDEQSAFTFFCSIWNLNILCTEAQRYLRQ
jgi:hypothetical protein